MIERNEIIQRIEALEEIAHPKCGIESFDGYSPLVERITALENKVDMILHHLKEQTDQSTKTT